MEIFDSIWQKGGEHFTVHFFTDKFLRKLQRYFLWKFLAVNGRPKYASRGFFGNTSWSTASLGQQPQRQTDVKTAQDRNLGCMAATAIDLGPPFALIRFGALASADCVSWSKVLPEDTAIFQPNIQILHSLAGWLISKGLEKVGDMVDRQIEASRAPWILI